MVITNKRIYKSLITFLVLALTFAPMDCCAYNTFDPAKKEVQKSLRMLINAVLKFDFETARRYLNTPFVKADYEPYRLDKDIFKSFEEQVRYRPKIFKLFKKGVGTKTKAKIIYSKKLNKTTVTFTVRVIAVDISSVARKIGGYLTRKISTNKYYKQMTGQEKNTMSEAQCKEYFKFYDKFLYEAIAKVLTKSKTRDKNEKISIKCCEERKRMEGPYE